MLEVQVLQGAVDVALSVLRDIEDFDEALRGHDLRRARGESPSTGEDQVAQAAHKLRTLIDRLDSIT